MKSKSRWEIELPQNTQKVQKNPENLNIQLKKLSRFKIGPLREEGFKKSVPGHRGAITVFIYVCGTM
jgi:hypothetical protein